MNETPRTIIPAEGGKGLGERLGEKLGEKHLAPLKLKSQGYVKRIGPARGGHWEVLT